MAAHGEHDCVLPGVERGEVLPDRRLDGGFERVDEREVASAVECRERGEGLAFS
jgi:hypothetical protein